MRCGKCRTVNESRRGAEGGAEGGKRGGGEVEVVRRGACGIENEDPPFGRWWEKKTDISRTLRVPRLST